MNDRQLKYILAIAKEGNLTLAAQKLFISQPSLSGMLAHMEEELGVRLFDRSVTPMILTYAGEQFVKSAQDILLTYHELQQKMGDIAESNVGRLNIGCGPRLSPYIIPEVLPLFMERYPEVQVNLFEHERSQLEQKLTTGNLDLVFTSLTLPENRNIDFIPLYAEEIVLLTPQAFQPTYCAKTGPAGERFVSLESLQDQTFVLLKPGHQMRKYIDRIFREANIAPKIVLETDSAETCVRIVECGMACTILPINERIIPTQTSVCRYSVQPRYYRQLCLCKRKGAYQSKIMKLFIDLSLELLGEELPTDGTADINGAAGAAGSN